MNLRESRRRRLFAFALLATSDPDSYGSLIAIGWGDGATKGTPDRLQQTTLDFVDNNISTKQIGSAMGRGQLCVQGEDTNVCRGDSGGPLMASCGGEETVVGLVSFGPGGRQCSGSKASVFTKISAYTSWINGTAV